MKKVFFINTFLLFCITLKAQVMWNLKGGLMSTTEHHVEEYQNQPKLNWMAGLEIEIPLSQKLNIETGLRYKNEPLCLVNYSYGSENDHENHIELPIRLTYKHKLGKNFSLHAGIGPYIGTSLDGEHDEVDANTIRIGIEPSVAVNWKCLSLGLTYNNPCFYGGYRKKIDHVRSDYKENHGLMLTLGIRFGSDKWKYVGVGLATAITVGAAVGSIYAASQGDYSPSTSSYSSSSDYSSSNSNNGSRVQSASKTCASCKGSGICRYCKGSGQDIQTVIGTNAHKKCRWCHGRKYCTQCNGKKTTGTTQQNNSNSSNYGANCRDCNGSGKCGECKGEGWYYVAGTPTRCYRCQGDRKCHSCNGGKR